MMKDSIRRRNREGSARSESQVVIKFEFYWLESVRDIMLGDLRRCNLLTIFPHKPRLPDMEGRERSDLAAGRQPITMSVDRVASWIFEFGAILESLTMSYNEKNNSADCRFMASIRDRLRYTQSLGVEEVRARDLVWHNSPRFYMRAQVVPVKTRIK